LLPGKKYLPVNSQSFTYALHGMYIGAVDGIEAGKRMTDRW
jgi:hypothetical protein